MRGLGFETQLIRHNIEKRRERGCGIFQLTNNKERTEANKFYGKLGLIASHDGYKFFYWKMIFYFTLTNEDLLMGFLDNLERKQGPGEQ